MSELRGLDMAFVSCDTPSMHMHVGGLALLDATGPNDRGLFESLNDLLAERAQSVPALRQVLRRAPMDLTRASWTVDEDFDVSHHVHRLTLPAGSDQRLLAAAVGEILSMPLDLDRPPWEMWALESVDRSLAAVVAKIHHSAVDGVVAMDVLGHLVDLRPDVPTKDAVTPQGDGVARTPALLDRMLGVVRSQVLEPVAMARLAPAVALRAGKVAWTARRSSPLPPVAVPFTAPRLSFNATLTGDRATAFVDVPIDLVKAVRARTGATFNDVISCVVGGALRRYLGETEGVPVRPVIAVEPISLHGNSARAGTNRLSVMFTTLATDVPDPAARLQRVAASNTFAKKANASIGTATLTEFADHLWPPAMHVGARLFSQLKLANRLPVICNLVLSSVPGPSVPLYLAGRRVAGLYPLGPIFDGTGLNVTALSSDSTVGFGLVACPALTRDIWRLADAIGPALIELGDAVGADADHRNGFSHPGRARRVTTGVRPPVKAPRRHEQRKVGVTTPASAGAAMPV